MNNLKMKQNELTQNEEQIFSINEELIVINKNLNLVIGQAMNIPNIMNDITKIND